MNRDKELLELLRPHCVDPFGKVQISRLSAMLEGAKIADNIPHWNRISDGEIPHNSNPFVFINKNTNTVEIMSGGHETTTDYYLKNDLFDYWKEITLPEDL